jgi:hypothetical protein
VPRTRSPAAVAQSAYSPEEGTDRDGQRVVSSARRVGFSRRLQPGPGLVPPTSWSLPLRRPPRFQDRAKLAKSPGHRRDLAEDRKICGKSSLGDEDSSTKPSAQTGSDITRRRLSHGLGRLPVGRPFRTLEVDTALVEPERRVPVGHQCQVHHQPVTPPVDSHH